MTRNRLELLGDPRIVGLEQTKRTHVVLVMGIEAGGNEDRLRFEFLERRQPLRLDDFAEPLSARSGRQGTLTMFAAGLSVPQ